MYQDHIHGPNDITEILPIIRQNKKFFRRVANISQLSFINYTTNTTISRLEHMIGTYIMACKISEHVQNINPSADERELKHLRIAAFLHDIGHAPFSHLWPLKKEHEDWSMEIVKVLELDDDLDKDLICKFIHPSIEDYINIPLVALLSAPSDNHLNDLCRTRTEKEEYCRLDCDRADYFQRDRKCGMMKDIPMPSMIHIIDGIYFEDNRYKLPKLFNEALMNYRSLCFKNVYTNRQFDEYNSEFKKGINKLKLDIEVNMDEFVFYDDSKLFQLFNNYREWFPLCSQLEFHSRLATLPLILREIL